MNYNLFLSLYRILHISHQPIERNYYSFISLYGIRRSQSEGSKTWSFEKPRSSQLVESNTESEGKLIIFIIFVHIRFL